MSGGEPSSIKRCLACAAGLAIRLPSRKAAREEARQVRTPEPRPAHPVDEEPTRLAEPTRVMRPGKEPEMEEFLRDAFREDSPAAPPDTPEDDSFVIPLDDRPPADSDADNWRGYFTWDEEDKQ